MHQAEGAVPLYTLLVEEGTPVPQPFHCEAKWKMTPAHQLTSHLPANPGSGTSEASPRCWRQRHRKACAFHFSVYTYVTRAILAS